MRRLAIEVVALLAGTGALAGFITAQFLPLRYVSRAVVAFDKPLSANRYESAAAQTLSADSLAPVVLQSAYYKPELDFTPVEEVVQRIETNATIQSVHAQGRDGFRVEFVDPDRYAALDVARMLVEEMGRNAGVGTRVIEPIHAGRAGPSAGLCTIGGMCAGLALGVIIASFARQR